MIRSIRPILLAFAMVGLVACGGDDDGGDDGGDDGAPDPVEIIPVADCPASFAEEVTTTMGNAAFTNATFTISVGDVVKFTPSGMHDMTSTGSGFAWDTGNLNQAACIKFNTAGTYPYECDQHPAMVGVITVNQ